MIPHNRVYNPALHDQKSKGVLIGPSVLKGMKLADTHLEVFKFLRQIAELYSIHEDRENINDLSQALEKDYDGLTETLTQVIYQGGLIS